MNLSRDNVRSLAWWWIGIWVMVGLLALAEFGSLFKAAVSVWLPIAVGIYWLTKKLD